MKTYILKDYPVTPDEYDQLDQLFGKLIHYISWQLIKTHHNHGTSHEDIAQDLRLALLTAGSYFKRQCHIVECLQTAKAYQRVKPLVQELEHMWENRTRHGSRKQLFGLPQERILTAIVSYLHAPPKVKPLQINSKFTTYCRSILYNQQKTIAKHLQKQNPVRIGMVSLSEHDFLDQQKT